jgi:dTMP kinase
MPAALQLLHVAAHLDVIDRQIRPRVAAGEIVLLDRYWWSTWVYGVLSGTDHGTLRTMIELEREHWGELHPEAVFLIRRPIESIPHAERADFVRQDEQYRAIAANEQDVVELSNAATVEAAVEQVVRELDTRLQQRVKPRGGVRA